jgi:hypothetical protein
VFYCTAPHAHRAIHTMSSSIVNVQRLVQQVRKSSKSLNEQFLTELVKIIVPGKSPKIVEQQLDLSQRFNGFNQDRLDAIKSDLLPAFYDRELEPSEQAERYVLDVLLLASDAFERVSANNRVRADGEQAVKSESFDLTRETVEFYQYVRTTSSSSSRDSAEWTPDEDAEVGFAALSRDLIAKLIKARALALTPDTFKNLDPRISSKAKNIVWTSILAAYMMQYTDAPRAVNALSHIFLQWMPRVGDSEQRQLYTSMAVLEDDDYAPVAAGARNPLPSPVVTGLSPQVVPLQSLESPDEDAGLEATTQNGNESDASDDSTGTVVADSEYPTVVQQASDRAARVSQPAPPTPALSPDTDASASPPNRPSRSDQFRLSQPTLPVADGFGSAQVNTVQPAESTEPLSQRDLKPARDAPPLEQSGQNASDASPISPAPSSRAIVSQASVSQASVSQPRQSVLSTLRNQGNALLQTSKSAMSSVTNAASTARSYVTRSAAVSSATRAQPVAVQDAPLHVSAQSVHVDLGVSQVQCAMALVLAQ